MNRNVNYIINRMTFKEIIDGINAQKEKIELPPFQRDAVWDDQRIENLWDSILRGFPIGMITLTDVGNSISEISSKALGSTGGLATEIHISDNVRYLVLDGQQRINAIHWGLKTFSEGDECRLWFDAASIDPNYHPSNKENRKYFFYLTKAVRPWGRVNYSLVDKTVPEETTQEIDAKLRKLAKSQTRTRDVYEILDASWPIQARVPVPFDRFRKILTDSESFGLVEYMNAVHDSLPIHLQRNWKPEDGRRGYEYILMSFLYNPDEVIMNQIAKKVDSLRDSIRSLGEYVVGVSEITFENHDDSCLLFERLNTLGLPVSKSELAYSKIKKEAPVVHNAVSSLYKDPGFGQLMSPMRIAHCAVRLAVGRYNRNPANTPVKDHVEFDSDVLNQVKNIFSRDRLSGGRTEFTLEDVLSSEDFKAALLKSREILMFDKSKHEDIGLPLPLLHDIRWRVWHTLAFWIYLNGSRISIDDSRKDAIRYALYDLFLLKSDSRDSILKPIQMVSERKDLSFPGKAIYDEISRQTGERIEKLAVFKRNSLDNDKDFSGHTGLLMWSQRHIIQHIFEDYDPASFWHTWDKPYDIDHIVPAYYFTQSGGSWMNKADPGFNGPGDLLNLRDCVGNRRFWPRTLNRSDRHCCPGKKLSDSNIAWNNYLEEIGVPFISIFDASKVQSPVGIQGDFLKWIDLSNDCDGGIKKWNLERYLKLKEFILNRQSQLIEELLDLYEDWM